MSRLCWKRYPGIRIVQRSLEAMHRRLGCRVLPHPAPAQRHPPLRCLPPRLLPRRRCRAPRARAVGLGPPAAEAARRVVDRPRPRAQVPAWIHQRPEFRTWGAARIRCKTSRRALRIRQGHPFMPLPLAHHRRRWRRRRRSRPATPRRRAPARRRSHRTARPARQRRCKPLRQVAGRAWAAECRRCRWVLPRPRLRLGRSRHRPQPRHRPRPRRPISLVVPRWHRFRSRRRALSAMPR